MRVILLLSLILIASRVETQTVILGTGQDECAEIPEGGTDPLQTPIARGLSNGVAAFNNAGGGVTTFCSEDCVTTVKFIGSNSGQVYPLTFIAGDDNGGIAPPPFLHWGRLAVDYGLAFSSAIVYTIFATNSTSITYEALNGTAIRGDIMAATTQGMYIVHRPDPVNNINATRNDLTFAYNGGEGSYLYYSTNNGLYRVLLAGTVDPNEPADLIVSFDNSQSGSLTYDPDNDVLYFVKNRTEIWSIEDAGTAAQGTAEQLSWSDGNTEDVLALAVDGATVPYPRLYVSRRVITDATPPFQIVAHEIEQGQNHGLVVISEEAGAFVSTRVMQMTFFNGTLYATSMDSQVREYSSAFLNSILPAKIVSFNAKATEEGTSMINWTTASETNNAHFDIEHSIDGNTFIKIGRVAGQGTTNQSTAYTFEHENPATGLNYYRLRQVDFDGTTNYSDIAQVEIDRSLTEMTVYPNPVRAGQTIQLTGQQFDQIETIVMANAVTGQKVEMLVENGIIHLADEMSGVWFIVLDNKRVAIPIAIMR